MQLLNPEKLADAVRKRATAYIETQELMGSRALITQNGSTVLDECYGFADAQGTPLTRERIFRFASMTKVTTAAAVMQQVELGRIDLNAPVSEYLNGFDRMRIAHLEDGKLVEDGFAKNTLRVFHLLCHTNGMDVGPMSDFLAPGHPRKKLKDTVAYFAEQPLSFDPFTATGYSESAGFDTAARIVELVSGEEYADYVQKHIFKPLDMQDTGFIPGAAQWDRFVAVHNRTEDGHMVNDKTHPGCVYENYPAECCLGGAGIFSTAQDYMKFALMLLNDGTGPNGAQILSPASVRAISTPHVPESLMPGVERWGLGVRVIVSDDYPCHMPKGSFGWSGAYGTHFWVDPVNRIVAIYLRNSNYKSSGGGQMAADFENDVYASLQ